MQPYVDDNNIALAFLCREVFFFQYDFRSQREKSCFLQKKQTKRKSLKKNIKNISEVKELW